MIERKYHPNGKLKKESIWSGNMRSGTTKEWYENGNLALRCTWRAGRWHGPWETYYPDGTEDYIMYRIDGALVSKEAWHEHDLIEQLAGI